MFYYAPSNAQCGYRYTNQNLLELHVTSAVQTDEAAIEYIAQIEKWYPRSKVMLIEKRDAGQQAWRMIHRVEEVAGQLSAMPAEPVHVQPVEVPAVIQSEGDPAPRVVSVPVIPRPADRE